MLASLLLAQPGFAVSAESDLAVKTSSNPRRVPRLTVSECAHDLLTLLRCSTGVNCMRNCFDKLRLTECAAPCMSSARKQLVEAGHRGSSNFLFKKLILMRYCINNQIKMVYNINGLPVCSDAWFVYHGLSADDARVKRVLAKLRRGDNHWVVAKKDKLGRPDDAGQMALVWMQNYIRDYADQMPNKCVFLLDPVTTQDLHSSYASFARLHQQVSKYYVYSLFAWFSDHVHNNVRVTCTYRFASNTHGFHVCGGKGFLSPEFLLKV